MRLTMRSPCTFRILDAGNPPISAWRTPPPPALAANSSASATASIQSHDDLVGDLGGLAIAVAAMEQRLGARLLHRSTRGVTPTEVGALLQSQIGGILHISTSVAFGRRVVVPLKVIGFSGLFAAGAGRRLVAPGDLIRGAGQA